MYYKIDLTEWKTENQFTQKHIHTHTRARARILTI